ncbi:TIGR00730 family Rossman fold protein [Deinococcus cavernae]|uniref:Cytokinin riboside 5'-monophosphate phosphoribohydrolase n=1 Tax=Deinococcus cavernae TaxID=2320857 RepID=A0A418V9G0_9DEIO|nr:TIGR00730 family Rossman fold protein [Deinococcus cavernae]RJF72692.1 TIGR00730 family Rossman fold protein [Deinococcus cavernae]
MYNGTPHYALDQMTEDAWRMFRILGEFSIGFDRMAHQQVPLVTVYGSARTPLTDRYYGLAEVLGRELVRAGFGVVTGGGPGIMQAANKGAFEAGGISVGLNIVLPHEQKHNPYQTLSLEFEYFHARKVMLARYAHAFVAFPGGFGTLDEMMEILTLVQTRKMRPVPIYFVGEAHWRGLVEWFSNSLVQNGAVAPDDLNLFKLVDDVTAIPADVLNYHDPAQVDGFKRPTELDRLRAEGLAGRSGEGEPFRSPRR